MSHSLIDAEIKVRQGENRAAVMHLINRDNGDVLKKWDIASVKYTIIKRGQSHTTFMEAPPDEPLADHTNVEIPVESCIRDDPPVDPIDNVKYNFRFVIPAVNENYEDISPFTESGAIYDVIFTFFPSVGGPKYVATRTIRVECI